MNRPPILLLFFLLPSLSLSTSVVVPRMRVTCDVHHRYAVTRVETRLRNAAGAATETAFDVTLPESAFISNFSMTIDGVVYPGIVKEKAAAKAAYGAAVAAGASAGLVRATPRNSNRFRVAVNVAADAFVDFHLVYEELLRRKRGGYRVEVAVRPEGKVEDLKVEVEIVEDAGVRLLRPPRFLPSSSSSSPSVSLSRPTNSSAKVLFSPPPSEQPAAGLDGRLEVLYDVEKIVDGGEIHLDEDGYFVHYFAPRGLKPLDKHVYFVLDRSGSMRGIKMRQLKSAMEVILEDLRETDSFNLLDFGSGFRVWTPDRGAVSVHYDYYRNRLLPTETPGAVSPSPIPATRANVDGAKNYIREMRVSGSTNIYDSLEKALNDMKSYQSAGSRKVNLLVFLTDGEANTGKFSEREDIIRHLGEINSDGVASIFSLGFGSWLDFDLLKGLSLRNNGFARKIFEGADAKLQLTGFYDEISDPLLQELSFAYADERVDQASLTGSRFKNYFGGGEIVVAGRMRTKPSLQHPAVFKSLVRARGFDGNSSFDTVPANSPSANSASRLQRLWAYLTVKEMLKEAELAEEKKEKKEIEKKALDLALKYNFVTKLTSMVVTRPPEPNESEEQQRVEMEEERGRTRSTGSFSGRGGGGGGGRARYSSRSRNRVVRPSASFNSFADSDPHFVVRFEGVDDPLCFDLQGQPGQVWNLLESTKVHLSGEIIPAPPTPNGKRRSYFGRFDFRFEGRRVELRVDAEKIRVRNLDDENNKKNNNREDEFVPWREIRLGEDTVFGGKKYEGVDAAAADDAAKSGVLVARTDEDRLTFVFDGVVVAVVRHRQWLGTGKGYVRYVGVYLVEDRGLKKGATVPEGLLGRLVGRRGLVEVGMGGAILKSDGRSVKVRREKRRNFLTGEEKMRCWFVPNSGERLFKGRVEAFIERKE